MIQVLTDVPKNTGLGSYTPLVTTLFSAHQYIILFLWEFLFEDIFVCIFYSLTLNSRSGGSRGGDTWVSPTKSVLVISEEGHYHPYLHLSEVHQVLLARIWLLVILECSLRETKLPSSSNIKSLLLGLVDML